MTELEQMTPNQRRALDAGLAALDTMAATWAAEVKLFEIAKHFASISDPDERETRIAAMVRQGFSEGAYRCYLDHKDASAKQAARIAELEAQIAAVAPAVDAQPRREALEEIATMLRKGGASLPVEAKGTIESAVQTGMSIALSLVEGALSQKDPQ